MKRRSFTRTIHCQFQPDSPFIIGVPSIAEATRFKGPRGIRMEKRRCRRAISGSQPRYSQETDGR